MLRVNAIVKDFSGNGHKSLRIAYTRTGNLALTIASCVVLLQIWRCCCLVRWVIFAAYFLTLLYLCLSYSQAVAARIKANSTKKCIWRKNMVSPLHMLNRTSLVCNVRKSFCLQLSAFISFSFIPTPTPSFTFIIFIFFLLSRFFTIGLRAVIAYHDVICA